MKVGIIGCGMIVKAAFEAISKLDNVEITSIYCRDIDYETAKDLFKKYNINGNIYTDYDEFLKDSSYDTVYCGLINNMHYEYVKKALLAGKHSIVEKPFTSTYREAEELVKIAKSKNLFIFEMVVFRYYDNYYVIMNSLDKLGEIRMIQCNQSQYSRRYDSYLNKEVLPVLDPKYSGGALYDLNVYGTSFIIGLMGEPKNQYYHANIGYNGIDVSGCLILEYDNAIAVTITSKDSGSPGYVNIQGTKGYIHVDSSPGDVNNVTLKLYHQDSEEIGIVSKEDGRVTIFRKIDEIIRNKDYKQCYEYMEKTLIAMRVMEKARLGAGIHFEADDN